MLFRKERKKLYKASRKGRKAEVCHLLERATDFRVLAKAAIPYFGNHVYIVYRSLTIEQ
jgi:hypothetical protein